MAGIVRIPRYLLRNSISTLNRRLVSTSEKNTSNVAVEAVKTEEAKSATQKNWITYGFHHKSKEEDRNAMHSTMFVSITLCITLGGFYLIYMPDHSMQDWAQRQAFLELRRREALGLPLVDPNLIDPAKVVLPTDEELGDTDIVI